MAQILQISKSGRTGDRKLRLHGTEELRSLDDKFGCMELSVEHRNVHRHYLVSSVPYS
jgi:hypothetical protein